MTNKKAQLSEFISIIMIIITLVIFLMVTRINSTQTTAKQLQESISNYRTTYMLTTSTLFPYLSIEKESIGRLMGKYMCYKNPMVKTNAGVEIQFIDSIRDKLDEVYEKDMWALELGDNLCITSTTTLASRCYIAPKKQYFSFDINIVLPCKFDKGKGKLYVIID